MWLPQYHDPPDIPDSYNISAALTADSLSPIVNMDLEITQLNLFSDRSYEWWEAGNRLNSSSNTYLNSSAGATNNKVRMLQANPDSTYEDNYHQFLYEEYKHTCEEYHHPFEDEFSQEVFCED